MGKRALQQTSDRQHEQAWQRHRTTRVGYHRLGHELTVRLVRAVQDVEAL